MSHHTEKKKAIYSANEKQDGELTRSFVKLKSDGTCDKNGP